MYPPPPPSQHGPPSWTTARGPSPVNTHRALIGAGLGCVALVGVAVIGVLVAYALGFIGTDAAAVCRRLRTSGAAADCRQESAGLLNITAEEIVAFDVPGSRASGQVLLYGSRVDYTAALLAYRVVSLAGGHVYGNQRARIVVQIGSGAPASALRDAKDIVDDL